MTPASQTAIAALRSGQHFEWYAVTLLALVLYAYSVDVRARRWDAVVLSLGFWAGELVWEIFNALILYFSGHSALWTVAGGSVYLLLVGLNLEIYFMFGLAPIVLLNLLPDDRSLKILGVPNRVLIPTLMGLFCVAVESILNQWGALVWEWWFWRWPNIGLIALAYVLPFVFLAWAYDTWSLRTKFIASLVAAGGAVAGVDRICRLVGVDLAD